MAMLKVKDLGISFGGLAAVNNFELEIGTNELVGLIGPNGAGKTTVFNMLTGVYEPGIGKIEMEGGKLNGLKTWQIARRHVARTFQNIRLFKDMPVIDNVKIGCNTLYQYSLLDAVFHTKRYKEAEKTMEAEAERLLKLFHLEDKAEQNASALAYGEQRRLEIARALALKPKLLLLDEPAAGMNPQETVELAEMIRWIKEEFQISILLIEHDMKLVMNVCDRVVVLCFGEIIADGRPEEIQNNEKVLEAYIGKKRCVKKKEALYAET